MEYSNELINMEQKVRDASSQMQSYLIQCQQKFEGYQRENPYSAACINLGTRLIAVKEALNGQDFQLLSHEEKLKGMSQCYEHLQAEECEGRKRKRDEEESQQQQHRQKRIIDKVTVPSKDKGFVAGRKFVNKIRLESTYGIRVTIPAEGEGNDILLMGTAEQVAAAKFDILESLPGERIYDVDQRLIRSIKSYDALALEALRLEHNVKIEFSSAVVYIKGKKSDCDRALTALQSIIAQRSVLLDAVAAEVASAPLPPANIEEEVTVPEDMVGFIAGRQFANARRLENTYDIKVIIPGKGEGNVIVLQGPDADKLAAARKDIIESIPVTLTQAIDPKYVGLIIGYKWQGIKRLCKDHDVKSIEFDDKKTVIIKGKKDRCEEALKAINAIVDKRKEQDRAAAASRDAARVVAENSRSWYS